MDSINDVLLPLGNAVLRIFWLGWAIGVFAAVVNLCARKSDARVRFASNFVFLILLAACLPVCMMTNRTSPPIADTEDTVPPAITDIPASIPSDFTVAQEPTTAFTPFHAADSTLVAAEGEQSVERQPASTDSSGWKPMVGLTYLVGVLLMALRLVCSSRSTTGLRRRCGAVTDRPRRILESVARRVGLRAVPGLKCSAELGIPIVIGTIRPIIALPLSMATSLTDEQLEAILLHEVCHLRRYDHVTLLLQRMAEIVVCFHPVGWYLSRKVSLEREHCSDDMVLRLGADRETYVRALCQVASQAVTTKSLLTPAADGRRPSSLRFRIARILGEKPPCDRAAVGLLTCAMLLGMVTAVPARPQPQNVASEVVDVSAGRPETGQDAIVDSSTEQSRDPESQPSTVSEVVEVAATRVPEGTTDHAENEDQSVTESTPKANKVRGTVLDPDGKPVSNAKLFLTSQWAFEGLNERFGRYGRSSAVQVQGQSDADGHFSLPLPENKPRFQHLIWAYTDKHGLTVQPLDRFEKDGSRRLLFAAQDTPLRFRALDPEAFQLVERLFTDDYGPKQSLVGSRVRPRSLDLAAFLYPDRESLIRRVKRQSAFLRGKKQPADMTREELLQALRRFGHHFSETYEIARVPDEIAEFVAETAGEQETVAFRVAAPVTATDVRTPDGVWQWSQGSRQVRVQRRAKVTGRIQGYEQMPADSLTMRVGRADVPIRRDGSFEFIHARGSVAPEFEIADGVPFYIRKDGVVLSRPHQRNHVEYQAVKGVTLKGSVVTPDGKPVANATVNVGSSALGSETYVGKTKSLVITGDDGRFTAVVHPGRIWMARVYKLPDGFEDFCPWDAKGSIEPFDHHPHINPGTVCDCGELELVPYRTITGQLLDTNSRPVPNALVQSYRWRSMPHPETRTDAEGRFTLKVSNRWLRFERMDVPVGTTSSLKAELLISTDNGWAIPAAIEKRDPWIARIPILPTNTDLAEFEKNVLSWGVSPRVFANQPLSGVLSSLSGRLRIDDDAFKARGINPETIRVTGTVRGTTLRQTLDELLPRYNLKWVANEPENPPNGYHTDSLGRIIANRYLWIQPR